MNLKRCEHAIVILDEEEMENLGWYDPRIQRCQCELKQHTSLSHPFKDHPSNYYCNWDHCIRHGTNICLDYTPIQIPTICFSYPIPLANNMEII